MDEFCLQFVDCLFLSFYDSEFPSFQVGLFTSLIYTAEIIRNSELKFIIL